MAVAFPQMQHQDPASAFTTHPQARSAVVMEKHVSYLNSVPCRAKATSGKAALRTNVDSL